MSRDIHYNNPTAMDTRGSYEPQGILAGWHRADRQRDFETSRDILQNSGMLANLKSRNELLEYNQNAGLRDLQRTATMGDLTTQIATAPFRRGTSMEDAQGDFLASKGNNASKVWNAIKKLPREQQAEQLSQTKKVSMFLRGAPEGADLSQFLDLMEQSGVDVSRWRRKNSAEINRELNILRNVDPEEFKRFAEMEKTRYEQTSQNFRNLDNNETQLYLEEMRQGKQSAAGRKVDRDNEVDNRAMAAYMRRYRKTNPKPNDMDHDEYEQEVEDAGELWRYQNRTRDPYLQQGAAGDRDISVPGKIIRSIKGKTVEPQPNQNPDVRIDRMSADEERIRSELGDRYDPNKKYRINPDTGKIQIWE